MFRRRRPAHPAIRALQTAGPSAAWLLIAAGISVAGLVALLSLRLIDLNGGGWIVVAITPVVAFIVVGVVDRDALIARRAIVEYAGLQARRLLPGYPTNPEAATAWLADPAHSAVNPVTRAYVLDLAGRPEAATEELGRTDPANAADQASAERLRAAWAASTDEPWDASRFDGFVSGLPEAERRWQRLALAFNVLLVDVRQGRPWRDAYVRSVRDLGPWHTTARGWFVVISQQFALAIVGGLLILFLVFIARL